MRDIRLKAMFAEMKKDAAIKLQLASDYASLANYWKFYDGETKQLLKYDVYNTKKRQEDSLQAWIKRTNKPEYQSLFADYDRAYAAWQPYAKLKEYYEQGIKGPQVMKFADSLEKIERLLTRGGGDMKQAMASVAAARANMLKKLNRPSEQQMLWQLVKAFYEGIPTDQHPVLFFNLMKQGFGSLKDESTYRNWAAGAFANSLLLDDAKWQKFTENPDAGLLQNDPLYYTAKAFRETWAKFKPQLDAFNNSLGNLGHLYLKAYQEANPK
jgi:hypothetical protein